MQEGCAAKGSCFLSLTVITLAYAAHVVQKTHFRSMWLCRSGPHHLLSVQRCCSERRRQCIHSHSKIASPNGSVMCCHKILTFVSCLFGVPAQRQLDGSRNYDYGLVENFRWLESGGYDGYMVIRWLVCCVPIFPPGLPGIFRPLSGI